MNKDKRRAIFERLQAADPKPTTELCFRNPFELLIAVILSAQATDVSVNKATGPLFRKARTPASILALGVAGLKTYIKSIGLYNSKAENIIKTCDILLSEHQGKVQRPAPWAAGSPLTSRSNHPTRHARAFGWSSRAQTKLAMEAEHRTSGR